jgi:ankyrin repeat protein
MKTKRPYDASEDSTEEPVQKSTKTESNEQNSGLFPIESLPAELLVHHVIPVLSLFDNASLTSTSTFFNKFRASEVLWEQRFNAFCEKPNSFPKEEMFLHSYKLWNNSQYLQKEFAEIASEIVTIKKELGQRMRQLQDLANSGKTVPKFFNKAASVLTDLNQKLLLAENTMRTAMFDIVRNGQFQLLREILEADSELKTWIQNNIIKNSKEQSPLFVATLCGFPNTIKLLNDAGQSWNAQALVLYSDQHLISCPFEFYSDPIHNLALGNHKVFFQEDFDMGQAPLTSAIIAAINELNLTQDFEATQNPPNTDPQQARVDEDMSDMEELCGDYIDIHEYLCEKDSLGWCSLHWAVVFDNLKFFKDAVQNDADFNIAADSPYSCDFTPLHIACIKGRPNFIEYLIELNCKITSCNGTLGHPLHLLVAKRDVFSLKILLNYMTTSQSEDEHYSINYGDMNATTALHLACQYGYADCVTALLEAGADPNIRSLDGTALNIATRKGHQECVDLLLLANAQSDDMDIAPLAPFQL